MFKFNPNPIILQIGSLSLSYYLLVIALGFLAILSILLKYKKKIDIKEEQVYDLVVLLIFGTIIGARIFHVLFWGFDYYAENPLKVFYIWEGGLSFHGGLLGAFITIYYYSKLKNISFLKLADLVVIPAAFFLALGRIANFLNSEILGRATNLPWCVVFENIDNVCRHPIQFYAAGGRFLLFFYLLVMYKRFHKTKPGFTLLNFVFLMGLGRFLLDFLREGEELFGLLTGQWFSLFMVLISIVLLKFKYIKNHIILIK